MIDTPPYRPGLVDFLVVVRFMGGIKGGKHSLVDKGTHTHPTNSTKKSRDYYYITKQFRIVVYTHTHTLFTFDSGIDCFPAVVFSAMSELIHLEYN